VLENYPENLPGVIDLGDRHFALLVQNDSTMTFLWWHDCPVDQTWNWIGQVGAMQSGHVIRYNDPLSVEGSLLCPRGCGDHGFITVGRWVAAA
jgi:hypothetical protein